MVTEKLECMQGSRIVYVTYMISIYNIYIVCKTKTKRFKKIRFLKHSHFVYAQNNKK